MSKRLTPDARYAAVVETLLAEPGVTLGSGKKGFGSGAVCVGGKIFALFSSKGRFVVKLSKARVEELTTTGVGEPFDPGHGQRMKEWLDVAPGRERLWLSLAREALGFVGGR
jgi:hypothetical protein